MQKTLEISNWLAGTDRALDERGACALRAGNMMALVEHGTVSTRSRSLSSRTIAQGTSLIDVALDDYFERRRLSAQQRRVMWSHLSGRCDKEIASMLGCSAATIAEHWRRIIAKTDAGCRAGVIADLVGFLREHELLRS